MKPPFLNSPRLPSRDRVPSGATHRTIPLSIFSRAISRSCKACSWFLRSIQMNSPAAIPRPHTGTENSSFFVSMRMVPGSATKIRGMSYTDPWLLIRITGRPCGISTPSGFSTDQHMRARSSNRFDHHRKRRSPAALLARPRYASHNVPKVIVSVAATERIKTTKEPKRPAGRSPAIAVSLCFSENSRDPITHFSSGRFLLV
jgi:hypothetical protein